MKVSNENTFLPESVRITRFAKSPCHPFTAHGVLNLTPKESCELCSEGAIIVDVREEYMNSFKMFKADKLYYLPYSQIEQLYEQLPHDILLIFADAVGLKSREGVLFMMAHGYDNVVNMAGGIVDWERDGLPLTTDITNRLSGSCMCQLKAREDIRQMVPGQRLMEEQRNLLSKKKT